MSKELTEGQKRVRVSFNPSALKRVEEFKALLAEAIDNLEELSRRVKNAPNELGDDTGDFMREVATAKTQLQIASMCGVAALTHDLAFKRLNNALFINSDTPQTNTVSNLPPHQQRVFDERAALATKATALGEFIQNNPIYKSLPQDEQDDLSLQANVMQHYLDVLDRRIVRF